MSKPAMTLNDFIGQCAEDCIEGDGRVIASAIRADVERADRGITDRPYTCRNGCGRTSNHRFDNDGWCDSCAGVERDDPLRRREAIRKLHRSTAKMLRSMGEFEDAAWHELEAERP